MTDTADEHFHDCHPEDDKAPDNPEGYQSAETEPCWHCATPTTRGACGCFECWDSADYVPPSAVYHCATCGRWWAWMQPRITKITFTGNQAEEPTP